MKLLRVGLTGGIASGKSQVAKIFAQKSIAIIDADKIARDLFKDGAPLLEDLKRKFGESIFHTNGALNRKALGMIVFNSPSDLQWLNDLTHPQVSREILSQLSKVESPYVIIDIPLLVDKTGQIPNRLKSLLDRVLVVDLDSEQQIERLCLRDEISAEEAKQITANQSTRRQKLKYADDIIDNTGSINRLESQVSLLHNQYLEMSNN